MPKGVAGRATCSVADCEKLVDEHGFCHTHAVRWRRTGNPLGSTRCAPIDRFMSKVLVQNDGCWLWTASRHPSGYGEFSVKRKMYRAHKWSYEFHVGPVPDGLELDHLCRVRHCVNPDHLEAVTHLENVQRGKIGRLRAS